MNPKKPLSSARDVALQVLLGLEDEDAYLQPYLESLAQRAHLEPRDRRLALELAMGAVRWRSRLDFTLGQLLLRGIQKADPRLLNILRIALYQLLFLNRIPERAVVHEAVEQSRAWLNEGATKVVNGVLRHFLRQGEQLPDDDSVRSLAVRHSHPSWMIRRWIAQYGLEATLSRLKSNNEHAALILRPEPFELDRDHLADLLKSEGARTEPRPFAWEALEILHETPFALPSFKEGLWRVQDEASQLVVLLLDPQPGENIWDSCAAPGGKSRYIWRLMKGSGHLLASDAHPARAERLKKELASLTGVQTCCHDAETPIDQTFDRILVDAPCTGLGILRRHPEIRWRRVPKDIEACAARQGRILQQCAQSLKPGGVLVYSVCSDTPEEGPSVIEEFLSKNEDFELEMPPHLEQRWAQMIQNRMLTPSAMRDGTDSFFAARLRRKEIP